MGVLNVVILSKGARFWNFGVMFVNYCSNMYSCESIFVFDAVLSIYLTKIYGFMYNNEQWK